MLAWDTDYVSKAAAALGLNGSTFQEHEVDGVALQEMLEAYKQSAKTPPVVDSASDKEGPKMRFLSKLRKWSHAAHVPRPLRPPPPSPPPATAPIQTTKTD